MSMMALLLIVWAGLTTVLVFLLIYRSTLTIHEDDQLFLDSAESHMQQEQEDLMKQVDRLTPWVRVFGTASGLLILVIAGIEVYSRLT